LWGGVMRQTGPLTCLVFFAASAGPACAAEKASPAAP
jgi:hypothetical protein